MPREQIDTSHTFLDGPDWARITVRVGVVFVVGFAAAVWAFVGALERLTAEEEAVRVLRAALQEPMREHLQQALRDPDIGEPMVVADDLVVFEIPRALALNDLVGSADVAALRRAEELYRTGIPPDPGPERTHIGLPRSIVNQLSAAEHDRTANAGTAATVLLVVGLFFCAIAGYAGFSAAIFGVPSAALFVGWIFVRIQLWVFHAAFDRTSPQSDAYEGALDRVTAQEPRYLLIGAIALGVAASVFRTVRPRSRAKVEEPAPEPSVAAPVAYAVPAGAPLPELAPGQQIVYVQVPVPAEAAAPAPPPAAPPAAPSRRVLAAERIDEQPDE